MQKLKPILDEEWNQVCEFNRNILADFLDNSTEKSPKTLKAYESNLRIWFNWVRENLGNKEQTVIRPIEFKRFQNWLVNRGCSSADCANKRAAISSLNNYITIYYSDEYPMFHNFINASIARPPKVAVHEKNPLTKDEFAHLIEVLTERQEWQKIAYLKFTLETGCRKAGSRQILKSVVDAPPIIKTKTTFDADGNETVKTVKYYQTHKCREKGRGVQGKTKVYQFGEDTMLALKRWLEHRGEDDCPYMFVTKHMGTIKQVSENTFNGWCTSDFSNIVGRPIWPHLIRASRATQLVVEDGVDIKVAQKLLGHENASTTEIYVVRDDTDDLDELYLT